MTEPDCRNCAGGTNHTADEHMANEEETDRYLDQLGKMAKNLCGKPYKVKRGGKTWTKYCTKKRGHWWGCGPGRG